MILNRTLAPAIQTIGKVELLDIEAKQLNNGIQLYHLEGGDQEVISLQIVFPAGRWVEKKPMQAFFTASQLLEGTTSKTSQQVSEIIDFHGAELNISASYDLATLHLVCLSKHTEAMMDLLFDVLMYPSFDQHELEIKRNQVKQKLQVNLQKTDFVAQRNFHQSAFGKQHPYGYSSSVEKYEAITVDDLRTFYKEQFLQSQPFVLLSGRCSAKQLQTIEHTIANLKTDKPHRFAENPLQSTFQQQYTPFKQADQTSIRFGRPTIMPYHKDFGKLQLTNAILGGYFGSRLMSNLREEKGLTYGVYSYMGSFLHAGYWFISTDVGKANREKAMTEIKTEIARLQQELVPIEELELVRNYVMGKFLAKVDGPFAQARLFRSLISRGQRAKDFHLLVNQVQSTTAEDVQEMAQSYFLLDEMVEIMVG